MRVITDWEERKCQKPVRYLFAQAYLARLSRFVRIITNSPFLFIHDWLLRWSVWSILYSQAALLRFGRNHWNFFEVARKSKRTEWGTKKIFQFLFALSHHYSDASYGPSCVSLQLCSVLKKNLKLFTCRTKFLILHEDKKRQTKQKVTI